MLSVARIHAAHPQAAVEVARVEPRDENSLVLLRREEREINDVVIRARNEGGSSNLHGWSGTLLLRAPNGHPLRA